MTETKPKRRWFRFSLRTLFVLVTIVLDAWRPAWDGVSVEIGIHQTEHEFGKSTPMRWLINNVASGT